MIHTRIARSSRRLRVPACLAALILVGGALQGVSAAGTPLLDPVTGESVALQSDGLLHVVFFATWCPPCLEEFPRLADVEARWQDDGYRLILVAVPTRHTEPRLKQFVESRRPPF